ncbi:hypothetical protein [Persephonella sp.]
MPQRAYKRDEVLKILQEAFEYMDECAEKGVYPRLGKFLRDKGLSINFFNQHAKKWKETEALYKELQDELAQTKLYVGLHAKRVKATHLITLDLMNNHGWREKKEEQQHQYVHNIDKIREKLKDEEE